MKTSMRAGLIAAVLGLALYAPLHATSNESVDSVTTGALPGDAVVPAPDFKGSAAFQAALKLLTDGEAAAAYEAAKGLSNGAERRAVQWAAIYFHGRDIDYQSIQRFSADAPDFAPASTYRLRVEQSLAEQEPSNATVLDALGQTTPSTMTGQIRLAIALLDDGETERATVLAKSIWTENFLTTEQEAEVADRLGALLDADDHWARAQNLMMHDRARGSERLLPYLSEAQKSLVVARAAVSRDDADAKALLDKVDPSLHGNAVYIFSRAQRARQFELWESAVEWLDKAPAEMIDADEWWYERRILVRKLLDVGYPELAYRAAAGYSNGPEARMVDALFHAGWIALAFLDNAEAARAHFTELTAHTTLPDSISQANYWLARAEVKLGNVDAARAELGEAGVGIRPLPDAASNETLFNANPVVRAVRLLAANGQARLAAPLLRHFGTGLSESGELLLAAKLAEEIGAHQVAIAIATSADQNGTPLDTFSFPQDARLADADLAAERAAVYAVMRQESMFQLDAVSSAGARGLMQLMPGTAEEVARKVGVAYSPSRLVSDAEYNALLGSTYLSTQLDRYDGSLVLAAAAYNAGPGNANKWIAAYGDPRADNVDPVIWVELIPFQETRTYVKRVLGNYLVYRERLGDSPVPLQQALRTIR